MSRAAQSLYFGPLQLIEFTRFYSDEVAASRYPFVDFDPDERWHRRIYRDGRLDVWLISWLPTQGTQLHDHGGSSGAFSVLSGELTETAWAAGARGGGRRASTSGPRARASASARTTFTMCATPPARPP